MADDTARGWSEKDAAGDEEASGTAGSEGRSRAPERAGSSVREASRETARELRTRARERTDRWTSSLGDEVTSIAHAFREAGQTLEEEGKSGIAGWTRAGADGAERLAGYLREEDPAAMVDDLTGFARSNPALFAGTTLVGGLLLGRFLRASEPDPRPDDSAAVTPRPTRPRQGHEAPEEER